MDSSELLWCMIRQGLVKNIELVLHITHKVIQNPTALLKTDLNMSPARL